MTDKQIVEALIERDEQVTQQFFFENCRPLFLSIIRYLFSYEVDYDEFVSEFYLYLMERDAYRLRQCEGRSTIYQWLKVTATRYFIAKRNRMVNMEPSNRGETPSAMDSCDQRSQMAKIDMEQLFAQMPNRRYVYVIRRLCLHEADPKVVAEELNISVDNLYNIKKRAMASLSEVALKEVKRYEKEIAN